MELDSDDSDSSIEVYGSAAVYMILLDNFCLRSKLPDPENHTKCRNRISSNMAPVRNLKLYVDIRRESKDEAQILFIKSDHLFQEV